MKDKFFQRMESLLDYLSEVIKLGRKVIRSVKAHDDFLFFQHDLPEAEGVSTFTRSGDQLLWLTVHQQLVPPPPPLPTALENWVKVYNDPDRNPEIIETRSIKAEGGNESELRIVGFYDDESRFDAFLQYEKSCQQWAKQAIVKKKIQNLYRQLFRIKERLKYDEQLELIWGQGLLLWKYEEFNIEYPIITQRMFVEHNVEEGIIHILAPDDAEPNLEFDVLTDIDVPDLSSVRKSFEKTEYDPADSESYAAILKGMAGSISPDAQFFDSYDDVQSIPYERPKVIDCWVLFVRKRSENAIIKDIHSLKDKLKNREHSEIPFPSGLGPFFEEPEDKMPVYEGFETRDEWSAFLEKEILFPLAANHEQIQILDRIERSSGVVVQGPPGTGKSHTIVNLICHFMAQGKRVLVTSQKDQALAVLHGMIPDPLKPLCLSVLTYDTDSRKKLEIAVGQIREIVSNAQPAQLRKQIEKIGASIDERRERITEISQRIKDLAGAQLRTVIIEDGGSTNALLPSDLAQYVRKEAPRHSWLEDTPPYELERKVIGKKEAVSIKINSLSQKEMEGLQALRHKLLPYLNDFSYYLPESANLINAEEFKQIAEDLKQSRFLTKQLDNVFDGLVFRQESEEELQAAIAALRKGVNAYKKIEEQWQTSLLKKIRNGASDIENLREAKDKLLNNAKEIKMLWKAQDPLKSVKLGDISNLNKLYIFVCDAEERVKKGKKPFVVFDKKEKKEALKAITVNDRIPASEEDWSAIRSNSELLLKTNEVSSQWNALSKRIDGPQLAHIESVENAERLFEVLDKFNAPFQYQEQHLPLILKTVDTIIIQAEDVIRDDSLTLLYKALKFKKEQLCFLSSKETLNDLKSYLIRLQGKRRSHALVAEMMECLESLDREYLQKADEKLVSRWEIAYQKIQKLETLKDHFNLFEKLVKKLSLSTPRWGKRWLNEEEEIAILCPPNWRKSLFHRALIAYLDDISNEAQKTEELKAEQEKYERLLRRDKEKLAFAKTKLGLILNTSEPCMQSLKGWLLAVKKLGKGKGKWAWKKQKVVQMEMEQAQNAVPVWIMPLYRVSQTIPSDFCNFDIVIVDEASQCNELAFVALMRAKKVIIVGDPEQISPTSVGIPEEDIERLKREYLKDIPGNHRYGLTTSLYALADIAFGSQNALMLREHFRCVPEIIQFSNNLCYHGKILPLRNPPVEQRIEPPLQPVFVTAGYREGRQNINKPEARTICEKLKELAVDPQYEGKTFGVISLVGNEQAKYIHTLIDEYLSPEEQEKHKFHVGDSYAFQGDERHLMLLSMVVSGSDKIVLRATVGDVFKQRFNVAASRAKDQMFLFHSVRLGVDLKNPEDLKYQLLNFFQGGVQPTTFKADLKDLFESPLEEAVYDWLTFRGYLVTPQVKVGEYRIDLVVEGKENRLAVECDGDRWHPPEKWWEDRMRQRQLERAGWKFWRVWGSSFYKDPDSAMESILPVLKELGIHPIKTEPTEEEVFEEKAEATPDLAKPTQRRSSKRSEVSKDHGEQAQQELFGEKEDQEGKEAAEPIPSEKAKKPLAEAQWLFEEIDKRVSQIDPSSFVDPLPHMLSHLLPKNEWKCKSCGNKFQIWIGRNGPFLKCTNRKCEKTESIGLPLLNKAFEMLQIPCKECGRAMKVAWGPKGPFPGCSGYPKCRTPEPWKDLRERLKQRNVRKQLGATIK